MVRIDRIYQSSLDIDYLIYKWALGCIIYKVYSFVYFNLGACTLFIKLLFLSGYTDVMCLNVF